MSKIENGKLEQHLCPREDTIRKLARQLSIEVDELLLLAGRIPESIKKRVVQRPEVFRRIAALDDESLDRLLDSLEK